jgi:pimeloyl-ACP methyl ester carboxylesterase
VSVDQSAHPDQALPGLANAKGSRLLPALRHLAAFAILLGGQLWVAGWLTAWSTCWFIWLGIGAVSALIAGTRRGIALVALGTLAVHPMAAFLGLERATFEWMNWAVLTLVGGMVTGAGYALTIAVVSRFTPAERRQAAGRGGRAFVVGSVALGLLGVAVWAGYSGYVGSTEILDSAKVWEGCDNPMTRFGWTYEAVNYDLADDANLAAANKDMQHCSSQGTPAGSDVVTSDGVPIAAFYIPAASGAAATAPTIVIAPGWKSNKSEILKYAPFFHDRFNLVLPDLRNQARSGGDTSTWGVREQLDIRAVVDWLEREKHPVWIGAMGNSMGAAVVTAAAANDERIRALVLDSMHSSIVVTFGDGVAYEARLPGYPSAWAMIGLASLRSGEDLTAVDPQRTIARLGNRPVLLIHGTADGLDTPLHSAELNLAAAQAARVPVTLEYCQGGTHGRLVEKCPAEWQAWVNAFLAGLPDLAWVAAGP